MPEQVPGEDGTADNSKAGFDPSWNKMFGFLQGFV